MMAIIAVVVIIAGVGSVVYFAGPSVPDSPNGIVQQSLIKLLDLKSYKQSGEIKSGFATNGQETSLSVDFSGFSDRRDLNNIKGSGLFSFSLNGFLPEMSKEEDFQEDEISISAEMRITNNETFYIKINKFPTLGLMDLSSLEGKWVKINLADLEKQLNLLGVEEYQELKKSQEVTSEDIEEMKNLLSQYQIFKVTEELADEKVNGATTYHYKVDINDEELKNFLTESLKTEDEKDQLNDAFSAIFSDPKISEQLKDFEIEIWIGKKDNLIYKIFVNGKMLLEESMGDMTFSLSLLLSDFNKKVVIDIPEETKSLEEVMGTLFLSGMAGVKEENIKSFEELENIERNIDTDGDGIYDDVEFIFGSDPNTKEDILDSDNDGLPDELEIYIGLDPNNPDSDGDGINDYDDED